MTGWAYMPRNQSNPYGVLVLIPFPRVCPVTMSA